MAARPLRGRGGRAGAAAAGDGLELRAAAAIAAALAELAELGQPGARAPAELAATIEELDFRVWSGPVEGRVRIANPYRLRAGRFDHVIVGSLQDGEFPRRDAAPTPSSPTSQRQTLGLDPRRDSEAEERYLFHACLALPRRSLTLSYRDSDEDGAATARSPLIDDVRALLAPAPDGASDPVEEELTVTRDLAQVVAPLAEAPSEDELARALAAPRPRRRRAGTARPGGGRRRAGRPAGGPGRRGPPRRGRLARAGAADEPGGAGVARRRSPPTAAPPWRSSTVCSYRWFAGHELDPQLLDPVPDPLVQGGLMHEALDRLYRERPGGDPLPRPGPSPPGPSAARELVAEIVAERELGDHPAERAMARRVERLLERFLAEEAERETGGFEPWLLEAGFGEHPDAERPVLDLGGWGLHGAIDRVDRSRDGRAVVIDYKLAGQVTPREKFEERAKLQLPLYLLAVAEHWGAQPVGALYHPLRGTSARRPARASSRPRSPRTWPATGSTRTTSSSRRSWRSCWTSRRRRAGEIVARMRSGEIRRDPGPRAGPARPRRLPRLLHLRVDLPPRPRRPSTQDEEAEER